MNLLKRAYPFRLEMNAICRACFGNPKRFQKRGVCIVCKMSRADYVKAKYEHEINEMLYLRDTWEKVRNFRQASTGISMLDDVIIFLFGLPYSDFWQRKRECRDLEAYKKTNEFLLKKLSIEAEHGS